MTSWVIKGDECGQIMSWVASIFLDCVMSRREARELYSINLKNDVLRKLYIIYKDVHIIEETWKVLIEKVLELCWNSLGTAWTAGFKQMTQDYRLNSVCHVLPGEGLHEDEWWQGFTTRAKDETWPEAARQMMPYSSWKPVGYRLANPSNIFEIFFDHRIIDQILTSYIKLESAGMVIWDSLHDFDLL